MPPEDVAWSYIWYFSERQSQRATKGVVGGVGVLAAGGLTGGGGVMAEGRGGGGCGWAVVVMVGDCGLG